MATSCPEALKLEAVKAGERLHACRLVARVTVPLSRYSEGMAGRRPGACVPRNVGAGPSSASIDDRDWGLELELGRGKGAVSQDSTGFKM